VANPHEKVQCFLMQMGNHKENVVGELRLDQDKTDKAEAETWGSVNVRGVAVILDVLVDAPRDLRSR
jgi:hypothetical protein